MCNIMRDNTKNSSNKSASKKNTIHKDVHSKFVVGHRTDSYKAATECHKFN